MKDRKTFESEPGKPKMTFDRTDESAMWDIAKMAAYSVVGKCIDPHKKDGRGNPTGDYRVMLEKIRASIGHDLNTAQNIELNASEAMGDGMDLVQEAFLQILEEAEKQHTETVDMEKKYTVHELKKKVWIKEPDSSAFVDVEKTPITEVYKSVRRIIASNGGVIVAQNGFSYLSEFEHDDETGKETEYYRRLPRYSDLGGEVVDSISKASTRIYQVEKQEVDYLDDILAKLKLTERQKQILALRYKGYGYKSIATYLDVKPESIKCQIKRIAEKAKNAGLDISRGNGIQAVDKQKQKEEVKYKLHHLHKRAAELSTTYEKLFDVDKTLSESPARKETIASVKSNLQFVNDEIARYSSILDELEKE